MHSRSYKNQPIRDGEKNCTNQRRWRESMKFKIGIWIVLGFLDREGRACTQRVGPPVRNRSSEREVGVGGRYPGHVVGITNTHVIRYRSWVVRKLRTAYHALFSAAFYYIIKFEIIYFMGIFKLELMADKSELIFFICLLIRTSLTG